MPLHYNTEEELFNRLLKTKLNYFSNDLLQSESSAQNWQAVLDEKLDKTANIISSAASIMSTASMLAPLAGPAGVVAVSVANTAITVAGTLFILAQTASNSFRMIHRPDGSTENLTEKEISIDQHRLLWTLRLEETADILTQRYCHFLTQKINPEDIVHFIDVGTERIIKKIKEALAERKKQLARTSQLLSTQDIIDVLNPIALADYLLDESVYISNFHSITKVRLKEAHDALSLFKSKAVDIPGKWAYGRARIGYFHISSGTIMFDFYKSDSESNLYRTDTTLPHCGYAILPAPHLLPSQITRNKRTLKRETQSTPEHAPENFHLNYFVTPDDIHDYLSSFERSPEKKCSLNSFLSQKYRVRITACCHDDSLSLIDLSHGDYSDVDFRHATLTGNLSYSSWHRATLSECIFDGCILTQVSFQHANLISSHFTNLTYTGDFSHTRLNNAKVTESRIGQTITLGADLSLFEIGSNVLMEDANKEWAIELITNMSATFPQLQEKQRELQEELLSFQKEQTKFNIRMTEQISIFRESIKPFLYESLQEEIIQNAQYLYTSATTINYAAHNVKKLTNKGPEESLYLDALSQFHDDATQQILIVHSPVNSGKTIGLYLSLLKFSTFTPIITHGAQIQDNSDNLVDAILRTRYDLSGIEQLKQHGEHTVIIDGLEHCKLDLSDREIAQECYDFAKKCKKNWKFIFLATTEYLELELSHYPTQFQLNSDKEDRLLSYEYQVQSPTSDQIKDYLTSFYPESIDYIHERLGDLPQLIQNVGMLDIICNVLAELQDDPLHPQTHAQVYERFLKRWEEKVLPKKSTRSINAKSISLCVQDHAFAMYVLKSDHIALPDPKSQPNALVLERQRAIAQLQTINSEFDYLWQGTWRQTFKISPMVMKDGTYRLIPPFDHFGLATKLIDVLLEPESASQAAGAQEKLLQNQLLAWNHGHLTQNRYLPTLMLMQQIIEKHHEKNELLLCLYKMISASSKKYGKQWAVAASNAITLLFMVNPKAAYTLPTLDEWQGIQVPNARLPNADLSELNLNNSDFSGAYLDGAKLTLTSMRNSQLKDTSYSGEVSNILTLATSECMAAYPAPNTLIIACSIQDDPKSERRSIKLFSEDGKTYPSLKGHNTPIRAMAFGVQNAHTNKSRACLATTSTHGEKIRFWSFEGEHGKDVATIKTGANLRINSLIWHANGEILASAGDDGAVRIWSFTKLSQIFEYLPKHNPPAINSVLFGKKTPILVAAGQKFTLLFWQLAFGEDGLDEAPLPIVPPLPDGVDCSITCIDLSPDETKIALGCENGDIYLIPLRGINDYDKIIQCKNGHEGARVHAINWNERCLISSGENKTIRVWNPLTGDRTAIYYNDIPVKQLLWSAQRQKIIAIQPARISLFDPDFAANLSISEDILYPNTSIAAINTWAATTHSDGKIWLRSTAAFPPFPPQCIRQSKEHFIELAWSNTGIYLAARTAEHRLHILEIRPHERSIFSNEIAYTVIPPDIEQIIWVDESLLLIDIRQQTFVLNAHNIWQPTLGNVTVHPFIQTSPDEHWVAYIDSTHTAQIIINKTSQSVWRDTVSHPKQRFLWLTNGASTYFLIGTPNEIRIFDASSGKIAKKPCKIISSGMISWAYAEPYLYLMTLKRVDMFDLRAWLSPRKTRGATTMSWGQDIPMHGYDVREAKGLNNTTMTLLKQMGAETSPPSLFRPVFIENLTINLFSSASAEKKLESPPTPYQTSLFAKSKALSIWGPVDKEDNTPPERQQHKRRLSATQARFSIERLTPQKLITHHDSNDDSEEKRSESSADEHVLHIY